MLGFVLFTCLLLYAEGISKARSDIVARNSPHIIDATEDGIGDSPLVDGKVKLAHLSKKEEIEESSGAPAEVDSKFFESKKGGEEEDDADDDNDDEEEGGQDAEDAAKKSALKAESSKKEKKATESSKRKTKIESVKKAIKKSRSASAEPKPTIGMKSKISVNFKKSATKKEDKEQLSDTAAKRKEITAAEDEEEDATDLDLSGGGSGDEDADGLSGDARSLDDGDSDADEEEEEEDDDDTRKIDPEAVHITPKEKKAQPNLNDFPDDSKSSLKAKSKETDKEDADKKSSDDATELDDIKIEELLNPKKGDKKKGKKKALTKKVAEEENMQEGKISLVLQQNFNVLYENKDSPSYNMLAGNIKKDVEKMAKGTHVKDVTFSEVSVEGNPRQSGKTKANFNIKASTNDWMKELLKLVDSGDIDGLRVIKGSLEIEEE